MRENTDSKTGVHSIILVIVTIASIGLILESISEKWEFWVPPLLIGGVIASWWIHFAQYGAEKFRENFYLVFSMMAAFFHGMHESSFFDVVVISSLLMVGFSLCGRIVFLRLILIEYFVIIFVQLVLALFRRHIEFSSMNISRIILHTATMLCMYFVCIRSISIREKLLEVIEEKEAEKEASNADMDNFLVNISHELRTPVNVVIGMSSLFMKKKNSREVASIRDAGIRLSHQIEDIQDYTEILRGDARLEEEFYMMTSLINDVITSYKAREGSEEIELIVDLDPNIPATLRGDIKKLHKIFRHLVDNALKFTRKGGIYVRVTAIRRDYGVNLLLEVSDTGIGMTRHQIENAATGLFQANKKRNRSTGGIGLGLKIVMGFVHSMSGFVTIESEGRRGTTVRVSIPQDVIDDRPCISVENPTEKYIIFHVIPEQFKVPEVRQFYERLAFSTINELKVNLFSAGSVDEVKKLVERLPITNIFMGEPEYKKEPEYYDYLSTQGVSVTVCSDGGLEISRDSRVIIVPKPMYVFPVAKILNGVMEPMDIVYSEDNVKPDLKGVRALVVDDEPMNLVVATGLFRDYGMLTNTADSGMASLEMVARSNYDIIFMDHMMPEMDGVEAMKKIRDLVKDREGEVKIVALTANAVSGAREMFMREGFDGFISKPIDLGDFERVMKRVLPDSVRNRGL
ncbi:MAG: response regulator [Butyrivibrio sp.]|nr:response regulator [Butyrivibrio sp.]